MVTSVRIHGRGRPLAIDYFCQGRNRGCMDEITTISLNLSRALLLPPIGIDMTPGDVAFWGVQRWRMTHITDGFSRTTENMQIVHGQKMANYHRHHFVLSFSAAAAAAE